MATEKHILFAPLGAECTLCGAEILERYSGSDSPVRYLHILDEDERRARLEDSSGVTAAERRLHRLRLDTLEKARKTLLDNAHIARFLSSTDGLLWPPAALLSEAVDAACLQDDMVGRPALCNALKEAVNHLLQEQTFPGVHLLSTALPSGSLFLYTQPANGTELTKNKDGALLSSWKFSVRDVPREHFDIMESLRISAHTTSQLCSCLLPKNSRALEGVSLADILHLHKTALLDCGIGLLLSVEDALRFFNVKESVLASWMQSAAVKGHRVRLGAGVFATVVHRTMAVLLSPSSPSSSSLSSQREPAGKFRSDAITSAQRTFVESQLRKPFHTALETGEVVISSFDESNADALLKQVFLSPVHQLTKDPSAFRVVTCESPCEGARLVEADYNPFVIIHGARVAGGFQGNTSVFQDMRRPRSDSDSVMPLGLRNAHTNRDVPQPSGLPAMASSSPTFSSSLELSGSDLHAAMQRALINILSTHGPSTRKDIATHKEMDSFRSLPSFESILTNLLQENTEYRSKQYHAKY